MNKEVILSRAGEQLIECTILHIGVDADGVERACFDKEGTRYLTSEELKNAFFSRCVVDIGRSNYWIVKGFVEMYNFSFITIGDGSLEANLYSAEYVPS